MSEIKHTPGPWMFGLHRYNDDSNQYEVLVKPFEYAGPGYYDNPAILAADGTEIVGCDEYNVFSSPADTKLMVAAPQLLEALRLVMADLWYQIESKHGAQAARLYPSLALGRAVIATATE